MALLVLLPAAAGTRIVPADLRFITTDGLWRRVVAAHPGRLLVIPPRRRGERAGFRRLRPRAAEHRGRRGRRIVQNQRWWPPRGRTPDDRRLLVHHGAQPPEVADDFLVHALFHRLEEREALLLVLDQRVALAVPAQADAFLQLIQAVQSILPLAVD